MPYKIAHVEDESFIAKTCHSCKKIKFGSRFRRLDPIIRRFVELHEEYHSSLPEGNSEIDADRYALKEIQKPDTNTGMSTRPELIKGLLIANGLRTKEQIELLK